MQEEKERNTDLGSDGEEERKSGTSGGNIYPFHVGDDDESKRYRIGWLVESFP